MPNVCGCTPTVTMCPGGTNCGTVADGCGGMITCGPACTSPQTCGGGGAANVCGCTPTVTTCPAGDNCGTVDNGCGGTVSCGTCSGTETCVSNKCVAVVMDMAMAQSRDMSGGAGDMAGVAGDDMAASDDLGSGGGVGGGGGKGGCSCDVGAANTGTPPLPAIVLVLAFAGALLRRRTR